MSRCCGTSPWSEDCGLLPSDLYNGGRSAACVDEGYPVVFFEHAGGSHYLNYDEIFSFLAGHGLVIVSTDHTEVDSSSMGWGTSDWWHSHDLLFTDTIMDPRRGMRHRVMPTRVSSTSTRWVLRDTPTAVHS